MNANAFDPRRIVEVLNQHRVEYVLVGGYAAQLYGARRPTYDIDIAPATTLENLNRLAESHWFCRRLGLLDCDQGLGAPLGIVERGFELRWG